MIVLSALAPVAVLAWLVAGQRWPLARAAWISAALAAVVALAVARLDAFGLVVALSKGVWTGLWIALIVVPALLLYRLADAAGAIDHLSEQLGLLAGTRPRQLLLFAWVVPAFVQGVAGFGVPVVIAAPMLVKAGMAPVAAVAAVLIGYHWSVTFGSMGSSFFVAAGTAGLDAATTYRFALMAAVTLGVLAVVSGLLLLRRGGRGAREAFVPAVITGLTMAGVLVAVAAVRPALASTAAGLAGLVVLIVLLRRRNPVPIDVRAVGFAALPYVGLTSLVILGAALAGVYRTAGDALVLAPRFPATSSGLTATEAVAAHQPLPLLEHPLVFLLLSCIGTWWIYRRAGWLRPGASLAAVRVWIPLAGQVAAALGGLTVLAAVMTEAGLTAALAAGAADTVGAIYASIVPVLGAIGSALGGSTTASNALLAPLHAAVAQPLQIDVALVLTGQTVGGNVATMVTPLNVTIATAAVGAAGNEAAVFRQVGPVAGVLLVFLCTASMIAAAMF